MTPRDFCYWLQGFFEINDPIMIDPNEMDVIKDHLKLVFQKETPDRSVVPFLGNKREVFDDKYVKEALGLGDYIKPSFDGSSLLSSDTLPDLSNLLIQNNVPVSC